MFRKKFVQPILVFLLLFSFSISKAQFNAGQFEDIQKLKTVPLLVVLEEPNAKLVKKLSKKDPAELKRYLASVEGKNKAVKSTIQSEWNLSKDIQFISSEELKAYKTKENNGKYAYLTTDVYRKVRSKKSETGYFAYTNYSLYILGDVTPLYTQRYGSTFDTNTLLPYEDMELALEQMQSQFRHKENLIAKRRAKKDLRKDTKLAKAKFSDE